MKKLVYLMAAASMTCSVACQNSASYKIAGTVEGAEDGTVVYLQEFENGELSVLDSATVKGGKFVFTGRQDSTVSRFITCGDLNEGGLFVDFFLENGTIEVSLGMENKAFGTPSNDIYQGFKDKFIAANKEMTELYIKAQNDSSLSESQKAELMEQVEKKDSANMAMTYQMLEDNIGNTVGVYLLPNFLAAFDLDKQKALLDQVPEALVNEEVQELKANVELAMKTGVGQKYVDFSMQTPEGETVSLSQFISQNKVTLIDFWASWCGPCIKEMPNVVAAYNAYKSKGFGIVGVSLDENADRWKAAIKNLGITWPQMSDLKGWANEGAKIYGVRSIPATVLVDQDGTIIARNLRGDDISKKLEEVLR